MRYLAFIHDGPDEDGKTTYGISFPDFPGCISAGDSIEEVIARGGEALAFHIEGMIEDGELPPKPRSADDIIADSSLDEWRNDARFAWVPVIMDQGSPRRVNISLDAGLLNAIDSEAKRRGMTRSALLASAARKEISAA